MTCGRWPTPPALPSPALRRWGEPCRSTRGLKCGEDRGAVEDVPTVGDLAVLDSDPLRTGSALYRPGFGVVHDERGFIVTEGGDHFRAGEHLQERALETAVGLGAFQPAGRRVADDVVGDVAHGRVQVVTDPGLVVSQPGPQRGTGGICHGYFPLVMGICSRSSTKYARSYACRLSIRYVVRMPTVKKRPGRKRGEVTADDVVAAAI